MIIDGIDVAFGRLGRVNGDRARFVCGETTAAYRLIVNGVPGPFSAGFTDYVVCKTKGGWQLRDYETGRLFGCLRGYRTRSLAAESAVSSYGWQMRRLQELADGAVAS